MRRKYISLFLIAMMLLSNLTCSFALSEEMDNEISGNSLLVGNHVFELDTHSKAFTLKGFMEAVRTIKEDEASLIYYKDQNNKWFELIEDEGMESPVAISSISNEVKIKNGQEMNTNGNQKILTSNQIIVTPARIVESSNEPGVFNNVVGIRISETSSAKFAKFEKGSVDTISSASIVRTAPEGTSVELTRVDDKNIELRIIGFATAHSPAINTSEGSKDNQKDYNKNGLYGDLKLLLLAPFFTDIESVEGGGVYSIIDVVYNDETASAEFIDENKTRITNVEQIHYGVLTLAEGTIEDYNFALNGQMIAPTKVNDQGSIIKFEVNPNEVASVKITSKNSPSLEQVISLGTGTKAFTKVVQGETPDRVLASGPVSYFDYFLTEYDEEGSIRKDIKKTTFNTIDEGIKVKDITVPELSVEKTPLGENIHISFDASTVKGMKWQKNIYQVEKDFGKSASSRVPVQFRVEDGQLIILGESSGIKDRNGQHTFVIKSSGFNDVKVDTELVKPAGEILLSPNFNWWANNDLVFELKNFNYAITNPVHTLLLDGEVLPDDHSSWHVVSNIIRLEGDAHEKLTVGQHTLTVKITGYEDFTLTFTLEKAPKGLENPTYESQLPPSKDINGPVSRGRSIDAISSSSVSVNVPNADGSSGGGGDIRANIIFEFDQVVNAKILTELDMNTPYADNVLNWWGSLTKDAILMDDSDKVVKYQYLKNYVGIENGGEYVTYKSYYERLPEMPSTSEVIDPEFQVNPALYLNKPYDVKNMLEDGILGETYSYMEAAAKASPLVRGDSIEVGEDIVLSYDVSDISTAWVDHLTHAKMNSNYLKYSLDRENGQITFSEEENSFATGINSIHLMANGYKTVTIDVKRLNKEPDNLQVTWDETSNQIVVEGFEEKYLEAMNSVLLDGRDLFNDGHVGSNSGDYLVQDDKLILRSRLFDGRGSVTYDVDQQHTLKVVAYGYDDLVVSFTPENVIEKPLADKKVPEYVMLGDTNTYRVNNSVVIKVATPLESSYKEAIEAIKIDGLAVAYNDDMYNLIMDAEDFSDEKTYTLVIAAEGFEDKTFTIDVTTDKLKLPDYVKLNKGSEEAEMGSRVTLAVSDYSGNAYKEAIEKITVNDVDLNTDEVISNFSSDIDLTKHMKLGENTIVLKASGYDDFEGVLRVLKKTSPSFVKIVNEEKTATLEEKSLTMLRPRGLSIIVNDGWNPYNITSIETAVGDDIAFTREDLRMGFSSYSIATIDQSIFKPGEEIQLILKSTDYKDVVFTINCLPETSVTTSSATTVRPVE